MRVIDNDGTINKMQWIYRYPREKTPDIDMYFFPYAAGMKDMYAACNSELSENIETVLVQYPGHVPGSDEPLIHSMNELANRFIKAFLNERDSNRKFGFYGHSMGGLVALAVANILKKEGYKLPEFICMGAVRPPYMPKNNPPVHKMSPDEIKQIARKYDAVPEEILNSDFLFHQLLPIYKADFEMIETWEDENLINCFESDIISFAGVNDTLAPIEDMRCWEKYTKGEFRFVMLPDSHYFILNPKTRRTVMKYISDYVSRKIQV